MQQNAITVITNKDIGFGLHIAENKLAVNVEDLAIPVDVKLAGVDIDKEGQTMRFTLSDGSVIERNISDFLAVDTDTKIVRGHFDIPNQSLILTDSEGEEISVNFTGLVNYISIKTEAEINDARATALNAQQAAEAAQATAEAAQATAEAVQASIAEELKTLNADVEELKEAKPTGIPVASLAGEELGYLVSVADVA